MKAGAIFTRPPVAVRPFGARVSAHRLAPRPSDWLSAIPADGDVLGNADYSDCWPVARRWVIALTRAAVAGETLRPSLQVVLDDYSVLTGFDQQTGKPDEGTDTSEAMASWCQLGVQVNDQTKNIVHWLTVDPAADAQLAMALWAAGPLMATWALPMAMQDMANWDQAPGTSRDWTTPWATHETVLGASDGAEDFCTRTWGVDLWVHPETRRKFCVHVDVPLNLSPGGWLETTGLTPSMIDREGLEADMANLNT